MGWIGGLGARAKVVLLLAGVFLVVAAGWGAGWLAHVLHPTPAEALPTVTVAPPSRSPPTAPPDSPRLPTPTPVSVATVLPPTSTPAPTMPPSPTVAAARERVLEGDRGLYDVCRRHCPTLRSNFATLDRYARRVAEMNGLRWSAEGPALSTGDVLDMPPCP